MVNKILHFEDEEMLVDMYAAKFRDAEFDYKFYLNPPGKEQELIDLVIAEKPNLIIMDIIMPEMDGFKATKILKNNPKTKDIPIIGLCNMSQQEDIDKAKNIGMSDYLVNANITPTEVINRMEDFFGDTKNYKPKFG